MKLIFKKSLLQRVRRNYFSLWFQMELQERRHRELPWLHNSYRQYNKNGY